MNLREKFDAASFILGGEIHNCTKNPNSKKTIYAHLAYRHVWIASSLYKGAA